MDQAGKEMNWHVRPQTSMAASSCCCRQRVNQRKCQRATLLPECVWPHHIYMFIWCVSNSHKKLAVLPSGCYRLAVVFSSPHLQCSSTRKHNAPGSYHLDLWWQRSNKKLHQATVRWLVLQTKPSRRAWLLVQLKPKATHEPTLEPISQIPFTAQIPAVLFKVWHHLSY